MQITYKTFIMHLDEEPLDVGYSSEKVTLSNYSGKELEIGGQNGKTQLLITLPELNNETLQELSDIQKEALEFFNECHTYVITSQESSFATEDNTKITYLKDTQGEMGDFYGTRIADGDFAGKQTKALILISKDGAIFYDEFLENLDDKFNTETLYRKMKAAQECYTGKGCH